MATRRQEKFARVVKEAVSLGILEGLSDPRIMGMVSVTRVEMSADLKNAEVYLSIFGQDETKQRLTFKAIQHARSRLQSYVAHELESKFCPVLHLKLDEVFKKTLETFRLIDEATQEFDDEETEEFDDDGEEV